MEKSSFCKFKISYLTEHALIRILTSNPFIFILRSYFCVFFNLYILSARTYTLLQKCGRNAVLNAPNFFKTLLLLRYQFFLS